MKKKMPGIHLVEFGEEIKLEILATSSDMKLILSGIKNFIEIGIFFLGYSVFFSGDFVKKMADQTT